MIIWLASYPRSGNTALRTILHRAFGIKTFSLYDDKGDIGSRPALRDAVGHESHDLDQDQFYAEASSSDETYYVKTHDTPRDDAKAIYVVRDGRAAIVSYYHYLKDFSRERHSELTVKDVILGNCFFNSWSEHFQAWNPNRRPNTLLLEFGDIKNNPEKIVDSVSTFIGRPPLSKELPNFQELQKVDSTFFRSGSDTRNISEMSEEDLCLFWALHGELMKYIGYVDYIPTSPKIPQLIRSTLNNTDVIQQYQAALIQKDAANSKLQHELDALTARLITLNDENASQTNIINRQNELIVQLQKPLWKKMFSKL